MDVKKEMTSEGLKIVLSGRLDTTGAPDLEKVFSTIGDDAKSVILDMAGVEYVSSAGLRVILIERKRLGDAGEMIVINALEAVKEVFDMTGFSDIITIK